MATQHRRRQSKKTFEKPFETARKLAERVANEQAYNLYFSEKGSDSLNALGINPGDFVIVLKGSELIEGQLTMWEDSEGDSLYGFYFDNFGDIGLDYLVGCDTYPKKSLKFIGTIVGSLKHINPQNPNSAFAKELTYVCDKCGEKLSGSVEFVRAQGWETKGDETVCLKCDLFTEGKSND